MNDKIINFTFKIFLLKKKYIYKIVNQIFNLYFMCINCLRNHLFVKTFK
jgi:hypothetical protein